MENQVFESSNLFDVSKQSFVTVGGISKNCIRLLQNNKKKNNTDDIVFGDCRGIIYSITYLLEEPKILIKTDPYPKEINGVELDDDSQRIYFAVGNSIYSIDKDNKNKWKVEFNIASDIQIFKIINTNIWTITNNFISKFVFGEVTNSIYTYDNKTKIISFYVTNLKINNKLVLLIGAEDDKIKINEEDELVHIIPTRGGPSCFCLGRLNLNVNLHEDYQPMKNYNLIDIIEKPTWKAFDSNKEHEVKHTLIPDLISIYELDGESCFGIFDAKYYNIVLNGKSLKNQPGVGDVTKQYLYQLAYNDFIIKHEFKHVKNAFFMPSEEEESRLIGEAKMDMLYGLSDPPLVNISVVKLSARKVFDGYLSNDKFDLSEEIGFL